MRIDKITDTFQQLYNWHILMANVTTKTHQFFQSEGLEPAMVQSKSTYNQAKMHVRYYDPDKYMARGSYSRNEVTPVKTALFENNGLIIIMPQELLMVQINHIPDIRNRVNVYCKQIASTKRGVGTIWALNVPGQASTGQFDEKRLEEFLHRCREGWVPDEGPQQPAPLHYRLT
jgi:hypothetical protein